MRFEFRIQAETHPIQIRVESRTLESGVALARRTQEVLALLLGQPTKGEPRLVLSPLSKD